MEQIKTASIGLVPAQQTVTVSIAWDTSFPDVNYATGISIASNAQTPAEAALPRASQQPKGLQIADITKRTDGLDVVLVNPGNAAQPSDTIQVWAGN